MSPLKRRFLCIAHARRGSENLCAAPKGPMRNSRPAASDRPYTKLSEISMKNAIATLVFLAAAWAISGCSSKAFYGGMIGAGIGGLQGEATSGMLIGAGIGGMIDEMEDEEKPK